jgi:hypothetical protein
MTELAVSNLVVKPVQSAGDRKQFIKLPWRIYRDYPLWVPPLIAQEKELMGFKKHPFYERAEIQTFLASRNGRVVGRIAAIHNRRHNENFKKQQGFFGFFECEDDQAAASALLDAAQSWLGARGLKGLRGPVNPAITYSAGVLVEGFDLPPSFLLPYSPPYYDRLLSSYGLVKVQDLLAFEGHISMLADVEKKLKPIAEQIAKRFNVTIRDMSRRTFKQDVADFLDVFNRSLVDHWDFTPFSPAELSHFAKSLEWLLVPDLAIAVEVDKRLVGVALVLPDYNVALKKMNGRLFPFGFLHLLSGKKNIPTYRAVSTNVLPEYRLMGLGLVLMHALAPRGLKREAQAVEFSWVAESNSLSRGALEKGGAKRTKTYRVYDLPGM